MSETRHRTRNGLMASRTIRRNPGPQSPELMAQAAKGDGQVSAADIKKRAAANRKAAKKAETD